MVEYDRRSWTSHLFDLRTLRPLVAALAVCGVWASGVVWFHMERAGVAISDKAHGLVGLALGLLLVIRTNASYERYWEGRRHWGTIVNESRNLGRSAAVFLAADPALAQTVLRWTMAFPRATLHFLRGAKSLGPASAGLPPESVQEVLAAPCPPLAVAGKITGAVAEARDRGVISDVVLVPIDHHVASLVDVMGACERILKTPLPFPYVIHLRRSVVIYCLTLPFALVATYGWLTPIVCLVIAFFLLGIEDIAMEIENPFDDDPNDLPLEPICAGIERDLQAIADKLG